MAFIRNKFAQLAKAREEKAVADAKEIIEIIIESPNKASQYQYLDDVRKTRKGTASIRKAITILENELKHYKNSQNDHLSIANQFNVVPGESRKFLVWAHETECNKIKPRQAALDVCRDALAANMLERDFNTRIKMR